MRIKIPSMFVIAGLMAIGMLFVVSCKQIEKTENTDDSETISNSKSTEEIDNSKDDSDTPEGKDANEESNAENDDDWDDDWDDDDEIEWDTPPEKSKYKLDTGITLEDKYGYFNFKEILKAKCWNVSDLFRNKYQYLITNKVLADQFWETISEIDDLQLANSWLACLSMYASKDIRITYPGVKYIRIKLTKIYETLVREGANFVTFNEENNKRYTTLFKTISNVSLLYKDTLQKVVRYKMRAIFDFCIENNLLGFDLDYYSMSFLAWTEEKLEKEDYDKIKEVYIDKPLFKERFKELDRQLGYYKPKSFSFDLMKKTESKDMEDFIKDYLIELRKKENTEKFWQTLGEVDPGTFFNWLIGIQVHAMYENNDKPAIPMTETGKKLIEFKIGEFIKISKEYLKDDSKIDGRTMTDWDYMFEELVLIIILYEKQLDNQLTNTIKSFFQFCMENEVFGHMDVNAAWFLAKKGIKISRKDYEKMMEEHKGNWRVQASLQFISEHLEDE